MRMFPQEQQLNHDNFAGCWSRSHRIGTQRHTIQKQWKTLIYRQLFHCKSSIFLARIFGTYSFLKMRLNHFGERGKNKTQKMLHPTWSYLHPFWTNAYPCSHCFYSHWLYNLHRISREVPIYSAHPWLYKWIHFGQLRDVPCSILVNLLMNPAFQLVKSCKILQWQSQGWFWCWLYHVANTLHATCTNCFRPKGGKRKLRFIWASLEIWWDFDMQNTDCLEGELAGFEPVTICFQHR